MSRVLGWVQSARSPAVGGRQAGPERGIAALPVHVSTLATRCPNGSLKLFLKVGIVSLLGVGVDI